MYMDTRRLLHIYKYEEYHISFHLGKAYVLVPSKWVLIRRKSSVFWKMSIVVLRIY
jgi:hypothetical protein